MKKLALVLSMMFIGFTSYSQEFTFKRAFSQITGVGSNLLKLQGSISVTDTLVKIKTNGIEQLLTVETTSKGVNTQQFKSKINEDTDIRISLIPNPTPSKNEDYVITVETLDKTGDTNSTTMYYLMLSQ